MPSARPAEFAWVVALALLLLYEGWALQTGQMTLSRFVWTVQRGQYGPLLPFLVGLICGHFFWSGN